MESCVSCLDVGDCGWGLPYQVLLFGEDAASNEGYGDWICHFDVQALLKNKGPNILCIKYDVLLLRV